jgi:catechol 2,3-dioxygenase-like lactoylglutathione lyase family enzyme
MPYSSPMINIYTRDLPAALAFYGGLLGFEETFRAPDAGDEAGMISCRAVRRFTTVCR